MASAFPNLPGYAPTHDCTKTQWHKVSHKQQEKNQNQTPQLYPTPENPNTQYIPAKNDASMSTSQRFFQNPTGTGFIEQKFEPAYVKLDRLVLRFNGYFKESVVESNLENWRLRQLIIFYYLEDSSIMMNEVKSTNSGIPQGLFLKRQKVNKPGTNEPLSPTDFLVGHTVEIFGKQIKIVDADLNTRNFFESQLGVELGAAEEIPQDNFQRAQQPATSNKDSAMMDFLEHSLGGGRPKSQKQFLDNDRKVLKFNAVCDDNPYIIHYFLADDTIEVREVHFANNGKDHFPMLLKRSKVPKAFNINQPGQNDDKEPFITCDQFVNGEKIQLFSRTFSLTGVDDFTGRYMKQKYGRYFDVNLIEEPQPSAPTDVIIPPHNGFGDEQDSLGYVYKLNPVKPKKNFFKYVDNDGKILRWTARFNTQVPEDVDRKFIIAYYLADDTISIFEPAQKNSGKINYLTLQVLQKESSQRETSISTRINSLLLLIQQQVEMLS